MKDSYALAGVDTDASARIKKSIAEIARVTNRPEVLSGIGFFGGMYEFKGYTQPVLISSIDQVGTKTKIAAALNKYDSVGVDIVSHCVNDIFTCGAEPVFFLDYIGTSKLVPDKIEVIARGLANACHDVHCALIGGETGEMPGLYATSNDFDLVGFIVGAVEKDRILTGNDIKAGDAVIGLPSTGLHTNGYSLARKILGETRAELEIYYPELGKTAGEALLEPHKCYYNEIKPVLAMVKGMAHITGSGMIGNIPRVLPKGLMAVLESKSWNIPAVFELLQQKGNVDTSEMYHVFNMGVGMAVMAAPENVASLIKAIPGSRPIGEIAAQMGDARVVINGIGYHKDKVA